jgi:uncharacterized protein (TIGR02266 family)
VRIDLRLTTESDWLKVFDPRDGALFAAVSPAPDVGSEVRIDLTVGKGGPRVILHGQVIGPRDGHDGAAGVSVAIGPADREKINYINGFVRGGLLDLRERRRLPLRLAVTYGGLEGPVQTQTRDVNEEGVFVLTDAPLPEDSEIHLYLTIPGQPAPTSLTGLVTHTVVPEDDDIPGMGIVFKLDDDAQRQSLAKAIDELEKAFLAGSLPDEVLQ